MVRTTRRLLLGLLLVASSMPALAQQTTGNISGRALDPQGGAMPGVTVTAKSPQTGFTRAAVTDAEGRLSIVGASCRQLRPHGRTAGLFDDGAQSNRRQRRPDLGARLRFEGRTALGERHRHRRDAAARNQFVLGRRRRRRAEHREPAAQRETVRQPGVDHSRRRTRVPFGSHQEHAVLAADRWRQRTKRQLPD